jgi:hypothetical protein
VPGKQRLSGARIAAEGDERFHERHCNHRSRDAPGPQEQVVADERPPAGRSARGRRGGGKPVCEALVRPLYGNASESDGESDIGRGKSVGERRRSAPPQVSCGEGNQQQINQRQADE